MFSVPHPRLQSIQISIPVSMAGQAETVALFSTLMMAVRLMQYSPDRDPGKKDAEMFHPDPGTNVGYGPFVVDTGPEAPDDPPVPTGTDAVLKTVSSPGSLYRVWPALLPTTVLQT